MAAEHLRASVGHQGAEDGSLLGFYKRAIAYRQARTALIKGDFDVNTASDDLLVFQRRTAGQTLCCAFNFSQAAVTLDVPPGTWERDPLAPYDTQLDGRVLHLPPISAGFLRSLD